MSGIYASAREAFSTGAWDWTSDTFKVMLVAASYVPNYATHTTLANVGGAARLTTAAAIANRTVSGGVCKANPVVFANLLTTDHITGVLLLRTVDATEENDRLVALLTGGSGFGLSPVHEDTTVIWDTTEGVMAL